MKPVKLTGKPSAPYACRLGLVHGAKQISPALAYVERESPLQWDFRVNKYLFSKMSVSSMYRNRSYKDQK